jgi:hypothetical protein
MATRSLAAKLGARDGDRVYVDGAPESCRSLLTSSGTKLSVTQKLSSDVKVILLFVRDQKSLESSLAKVTALAQPSVLLWVCYEKGKAGANSLNRDVIRLGAPKLGFQVVSLVAVDGTWSALRLKRREA